VFGNVLGEQAESCHEFARQHYQQTDRGV
jgi:DNA-binding NarL/FixJ family response regulator